MGIICVVHLGHSHVAAMIPSLYNRPIEEIETANDVEHYPFKLSDYNIFGVGDDRFEYSVRDGDGKYQLNPVILEAIKKRIPEDREIVIVTSFGGNTHNALTLLQSSVGIDVVVPGMSDLPLAEGAQVVTHSSLQSAMESQCLPFLNDLRGVAAAAPMRSYHVLSPPPIKDDLYVKSVVDKDPYFRDLGLSTVTPALVRYKSWVIHSNIYSDLCKVLGVDVISPPEESVLDDRWLAKDCIGPDPTHGNLLYGLRVLQKIERILDGRFAGWDWIG